MMIVTKKLGEIGTYINGCAFKPEDWKTSGMRIIRIENLNNPKASYNCYQGEFEEKYKVTNGDILVSWSASLDAYVWNNGEALLNQHIFKVIPNEDIVDKDFLFFLLKKAIKGLTELVHGATMKHVNKPVFESFEVSFPEDKNAQKVWAKNLARNLAEIEKAREATIIQRAELKKLLDKLLEYEIETVLKSNGENIKLGDVIEITAKMANPSLPKYCDLLHVSAENIESVTGKLINLKSAKDDGMTSNKYFFDKGDVLYSKLRPYLRKIAFSDFSGLCSADMYPIKCNPDLLDSRFLKLLLTSKAFTDYANEMSARSRMPKLNRDQLYNWKFSLPSIEIQNAITYKIEHAMKIGEEGIKASNSVIATINILPKKLLQEAFNEFEND